jgi:hypothetical protein
MWTAKRLHRNVNRNKTRHRGWLWPALWLLLWPAVVQAASPYATLSGAGMFHVTDQTVNIWGDADSDGIPDVVGTQHNENVDVLQGPDQDWSGTAQIRPGLIHYDNFLGPRDQCTSGWGGAASGGTLIVGFDQDFEDGDGDGTYVDYDGVEQSLPAGVDFIVEGFGFCFNKAFSDERGTVNIYVADADYDPVVSTADPVTGLRTVTGDESRWVKISGWLGRQPDDTWSGNPNHNYASGPGLYGLYLWGDLSGSRLSAARYIKFELGDGGHYEDPYSGTQNTGRAFFIDAVKTLYHRPIAKAGDDRHVNEGTRVVLDGTDSEDADGDTLTCQWRQIGGMTVELSDPSAEAPSFTPVFIGDIIFELTVSDGEFVGTDTITITVVDAGINQSPMARAGDDRTYNVGDTVILDGSASTDPDGDVLAYAWKQTSGPSVVLTGADTERASFTAPNIPVTPEFELTVTDPSGLSDTDTVRVAINRPPIVDLSRTEATATENLLFTLDASRSWDPDLDELQYQWIQLSGPSVVLSDARAVRPTFMVPEEAGEQMMFRVTVSDGKGFALSDTVSITIRELYIIDTDNPATSAWQVGSFSYRTQVLDLAKEALAFPDFSSDGLGDASGFPDGCTGDMTLRFNIPVADGAGNDLSVHHFGSGTAEIQASIDGENWVSLGALPPVDTALPQVQTYDLADYPDLSMSRVISVQFVKIIKSATDAAHYIDGVIGHHTALTAIYGAYVYECDGPVDWVDKKSDAGSNALGAPDYDASTPGVGNCSGWMVNSGTLTVGFDNPLTDRDGADLFIYHFGQGVTDADIALGAVDGATTVEVSEDGADWVLLGDLPLGQNGGKLLSVDTFDFNACPQLGRLDAQGNYRDVRIRFVRINKNGRGYGAGKFIDAVEGRFGFPGLGNPAGGDMTVEEGAALVLGRINPSSDDFDETVYIWEQSVNGGPPAALSADDIKNPTFVAPSVDASPTPLVFKLTRINENEFGVSVSTVTVDVMENGITGFPADATTFRNAVSGRPMGLLARQGELVYYRSSDPDYQFSEGYIDEMEGRPKNLIHGMLDFTMTVTPGDQAVVEVMLDQAASEDYRWYKYASQNGWSECVPGSYAEAPEDGAVFDADRRVVTLRITDNGPLDDDTEEGIVRDPSGLGIPDDWHDENSGGGCFIDSLSLTGQTVTSPCF